ncbi:ABC transporter ATP-binding protein, partial [candidate division KSB1 bacterium]|nr:ABC transporter ATP-binding protein [candidate division KSB1 bacterium]
LFNERTGTASGTMLGLQGATMQVTAAVFLFGSMAYLSPKLTLFCLFILVVLSWPLRKFDKKIAHAGTEVSKEWTDISSNLVLGIKNLLLLQIYGTRKLEFDKTLNGLKRHNHHYYTYFKYAGIKFAVPQVLGVILICLITWIVHQTQILSTANLITYFYLFVRFVQMFSDLSKTSSTLLVNWPQLVELMEW